MSENLSDEIIKLCRQKCEFDAMRARQEVAWYRLTAAAERMAQGKHSDNCIGGDKGPCNCGAVQDAITELLGNR